MIENETVAGQQSAWNIIKKLGEGDAGDVYLVQSTSPGRHYNTPAILKRPRPSAFTGDVFRQSTQIRAEARILKALTASGGAATFDATLRVRTPTLLDESKDGARESYNGHNFIIIEKAGGLDMSFLARVAQMGISGQSADSVAALDLEDRMLVDAIARNGKIPSRLVLSVLNRLVGFIKFIHGIHSVERGSASGKVHGILWNDVKPDHLFWNAQRGVLTVIDWGNARFLGDGQVTQDRQFSWADDYRQLFEEMGRYLSLTAPELIDRLQWPERFSTENSTPDAIQNLQDRLTAALLEEDQNMAEARRSEENLLQIVPDQPVSQAGEAAPEISLADIQAIQSQVLEFGEAPDFERSLRYMAGFAIRLVHGGQDRIDDLRKLAGWAADLPGADPQQWQLVDMLARIFTNEFLSKPDNQRQLFLNAIQEAISRQWDKVLWDIVSAQASGPYSQPEPQWWPDLTASLRGLALGSDYLFPTENYLRPLVAVRRINLAVQAEARRLAEREQIESDKDGNGAAMQAGVNTRHAYASLCLKDEVIANWTQLDPSPPDCGVGYEAVESKLVEAVGLLPEQTQTTVIRPEGSVAALYQPKRVASQLLAAWNERSFLAAREVLRLLLLHDPDRRRLLRSDQAILAAPDFLARAKAGPRPEDNFPEWITSVELRGRELRNQVGGAGWLDAILSGCKQMRKGTWPSDLAFSQPELLHLMPWLARFERSERTARLALAESADPPRDEGNVQIMAGDASQRGDPAVQKTDAPDLAVNAQPPAIFQGIEEARLGEGEALSLIEPLDAWMAEARGSSARVVSGLLQFPGGASQLTAIKLMRMDQVHYALPLFLEEVKILAQLGAPRVPGVAHLLECGFILLDEGAQFPYISAAAAPSAVGQLLRIGPDSAPEFAVRMDSMLEAGWTPYLAIEKQAREDSLVFQCDAGLTRGQYQPVQILLQMSVQICDILQAAHERNIVYRDHKLLHYYWQASSRGIYVIDWNVARYHPEGLTQTDLEMDIVQFGARGLHHILTGRTAPGALPLGPTRPEEIETAAHSYQTQWTYDDQRLSARLRSVLERVLAGEYDSVTMLRDDLKQSLMRASVPDDRAYPRGGETL